MALKLHGASASPFVRKVRVVLAEKGLGYEREDVIPINVSPEYRKISPLGKIPALEHDGRALADSSVICAYLERLQPTPALYPSDPYEHARALWFEEWADTGLVNVVGPKIFFKKFVAPRFFNQPTDEAEVQKTIDEELPPLFDYLESQLGSGPHLVGKSFSIADVGVATQIVQLRHVGVGIDTARWPKLARWAAGILERPSFRAVVDEERAAYGFPA
ncbi:MAG TPA: glutathione S-transferase family protein [Candidatus Binatia bacterium]|nr:glutathione S-transferase family protein [Candidatus Binatia bacterium]